MLVLADGENEWDEQTLIESTANFAKIIRKCNDCPEDHLSYYIHTVRLL